MDVLHKKINKTKKDSVQSLSKADRLEICKELKPIESDKIEYLPNKLVAFAY